MKTEEYSLNDDLMLWAQPDFKIHAIEVLLKLVWESDPLRVTQSDRLIECRLTCQVTPGQYQVIDAYALFNLKPEIRGAVPAADFHGDVPIEIVATLKPNLLPDLADHATSAETVANYLLQLVQETPDHPLLHTENWLALSVKQQQESGEVGYTTLWTTLNPAAIAAGQVSEADMGQSLTQFFSDWAEANLTTLTEKATTQLLDEVGNFFNGLADASMEAIDQINGTDDSILHQLLNFFTQDDWQFTKLQGEPVLHLAFQGENGGWNCYARAREDQQQFIFYSICPIATPADKRSAIAEFITRANYGMTIGNFELDFTDGEIRYKTSIDVEGDQLSFALIKSLVYTNVMMMDTYLPGIRAVIEAGVSPEEATRVIEQRENTPDPEIASPDRVTQMEA